MASVFGYLARTILARYLTVAEFGLFYGVHALIMLLTILAYFGYPISLVKHVAEFRAKKDYERTYKNF